MTRVGLLNRRIDEMRIYHQRWLAKEQAAEDANASAETIELFRWWRTITGRVLAKLENQAST